MRHDSILDKLRARQYEESRFDRMRRSIWRRTHEPPSSPATTKEIAEYVHRAIAPVVTVREGERPLVYILPDIHTQPHHRRQKRTIKNLAEQLHVPALGVEGVEGT